MERVVPLVPPAAAGPLGLAHLPRTWLKAVLNAADMLWEDYFPNYRGFNKFLADGIGLDPGAFFTYLGTMPTYPQAERWVRDHATNLNPNSVASFNNLVHTFERPEDDAAEIRGRVKLEHSSLRISSELINLDDWFTMHEYLLANRNAKLEPMFPTVSSCVAGPVGIAHIPRFWMKTLLGAVGALPAVRTGHFGFDRIVAEMIDMDHDAAIAFIRAELPTYLQFESWLEANIPAVSAETIAGWNEAICTYRKPADIAAADRAEAGVPELSFTEVVLLNDMVDWKHQHVRAAARRSARS